MGKVEGDKLTIGLLRAQVEAHRTLLKMVENSLSDARAQVAGYQEEEKQYQLKITELEDKVKELEMKVMDTTNFKEWDWKQIHLWIMRLENERFSKYDKLLQDSLSQDETTGSD